MSLTPGTRLGVYEVTAKIGEGGMGEVSQAHDTTLDRDVALKVLPDAFTSDPDRLASSVGKPTDFVQGTLDFLIFKTVDGSA